MRAAAVDAVFVPGPRVHEWLDEQTKRVRLVHFKLLEQSAQRLVFASALHEIFEAVTNLIAEEALHFSEVDELADRAGPAIDFQQIADRRAVRIAAWQGSEILEA